MAISCVCSLLLTVLIPDTIYGQEFDVPSEFDDYFGGELVGRSLDFATQDRNAFCAQTHLPVRYPSFSVDCGKSVELESVSGDSAPKISAPEVNKNTLYTLIMFDPDAPSSSAPKCRSWLHWLIVDMENMVFKFLTSLRSRNTELMIEAVGGQSIRPMYYAPQYQDYNPPSPPSGSGPHRYRFLLLEQKGTVSIGSVASRCGFDVSKFVTANNMKVAAVNEFQTENN